MRIIRGRCVLLDANVVIALHAAGLWDRLVVSCEVIVPETVADESRFHSVDLGGFSSPIDLRADAETERITLVSASAQDVLDTQGRFAPWFLELVHPGELEALAVLMASAMAECEFCSADGAAVRAAAMLGLGERCVCLRDVLDGVGLGRDLGRQFGADFLREFLEAGRRDRLRGFGLA
jgi:hypothetical protein